MSYAQFGLVQAADFNTLAGGNPTTTSGTLNAVWATGGTNAGYGQTAVANVAVGATVAADPSEVISVPVTDTCVPVVYPDGFSFQPFISV